MQNSMICSIPLFAKKTPADHKQRHAPVPPSPPDSMLEVGCYMCLRAIGRFFFSSECTPRKTGSTLSLGAGGANMGFDICSGRFFRKHR
jgi:hypothetical protein